METPLDSSMDEAFRHQSLTNFATTIAEIRVQHDAMQRMLTHAGLNPLAANDHLADFFDARDELAAQMAHLGETFYHALSAGHYAAVAELCLEWGPAVQTASVVASSPPSPHSKPTAASEDALHPAPAAIISAPPQQSLEAAPAPLRETPSLSITSEAARVKEAPTIDVPMVAPSASNDRTNEASLSAGAESTAETNGQSMITREADEPAALRRRVFETRHVASTAAGTTKEAKGATLASMVVPPRVPQVIATVIAPPKRQPAKISKERIKRLREGIGGKGFEEQNLEEIPHFYAHADSLQRGQLERAQLILNQLSKPPSGQIANFSSHVGSLRNFLLPDNMQVFLDLTKELCCSAMTVAIAYLRFLQGEDTRQQYSYDLHECWSAINRIAKVYDPGYIQGLAANQPPVDAPNWRASASLRIENLDAALQTAQRAVFSEQTKNSQAKRERQSQLDREFTTIEKALARIDSRGKKSALKQKLDNDGVTPLRFPTPRHKQRRLEKKGQAAQLADAVSPAEHETMTEADNERIRQAFIEILGLHCRLDHPRLLSLAGSVPEILATTPELQVLEKELADQRRRNEQVDNTVESEGDTWAFRDTVTLGKKAFIVGGNRNAVAEKRILEHFGFSELKWFNTTRNQGKTRMDAVRRGMTEGQYDFYIAIENLVGHSWSWLIFSKEAADNVHPILISGYGVRAIEQELERTLQLRSVAPPSTAPASEPAG